VEVLQVILTSVLSVIAIFIVGKLMGHKQVAQMDFFDYITGITIGSIAAELATELEKPWKPLVAMAVYGFFAITLSILSNKLPRIRKYVDGDPIILMDNGKIYRENLKKSKLDLTEFQLLCRQAGYFDLRAVQTAVYEYNGKLTILPVSSERPATPSDMNLNPQQEYLYTEIIMDGRIQGENLKRMGLDETWLQQQLKAQGYHSAKDVFLGVCDKNHSVQFYPAK
jgi:uncharacterized membrane protein YcaP (DUF421 family)